MAFETLRGAVGGALQQKLFENSQLGQQQIIGSKLKNRLAALQVEEQFPIQMEKLKKSIDFITASTDEKEEVIERTTAIEQMRTGQAIERGKATETSQSNILKQSGEQQGVLQEQAGDIQAGLQQTKIDATERMQTEALSQDFNKFQQSLEQADLQQIRSIDANLTMQEREIESRITELDKRIEATDKLSDKQLKGQLEGQLDVLKQKQAYAIEQMDKGEEFWKKRQESVDKGWNKQWNRQKRVSMFNEKLYNKRINKQTEIQTKFNSVNRQQVIEDYNRRLTDELTLTNQKLEVDYMNQLNEQRFMLDMMYGNDTFDLGGF